jgi:hypothetical protein
MGLGLRTLLKNTPARYLYHRMKSLVGGAHSQSDEAEVLARLAREAPKTFVEFGFHPTEYNCIGLTDFAGLLIDGDAGRVGLARSILPKRIEIRHAFLTLDNLRTVTACHAETGVLSIDVDGNDYWFLEALLPELRPHVVSVEYNASFGRAPITVPYDPAFERHAKHPSGWYHGASLAALTKLCARHGMKLVAVTQAGLNGCFVRDNDPLPAIDPTASYRENALRNRWSKTTAAEQWERIKHLAFVEV